MCSEQCEDTGFVINAGAGYFSRSAVLTGPGAIIKGKEEIPSPEEVMENWVKISSLDNPVLFNDMNDLFGAFGSALQ